MSKYKQLIIIADKLPKSIHNKKIDFEREITPHMQGVELLYTSLLPGPELEGAKIAKKLNIPHVATIPFKQYPKYWPKHLKNQYYHLLKRSIKRIYVDRQPDYICQRNLPDLHGYTKIRTQVRWTLSRLSLFEKPTKIILYTPRFASIKKDIVIHCLNRVETNRYLLLQKVFNLPNSLSFLDELPF